MTFLSHTEKKWRNFQAQLEAIRMRMNPGGVWRSLPINLFYHISIHSPNHLPDFLPDMYFKRIDIRHVNTITYSEIQIQRLGEGYDTDCYSYKLDTNFNYYRIRVDCVNDCYQDKMRHLCKVDRGIFMSHSLIRKEYLVNVNDKIISCYDPDYNVQIESIKEDCQRLCKLECNDKYYSISLESTLHALNNEILKYIFIQHSEYPDIFVKLWMKLSKILK